MVGALIGGNVLTAEVSAKIRFFVGNDGPNLVSSFHVIGKIFDTVCEDGGTAPMHNLHSAVFPKHSAKNV